MAFNYSPKIVTDGLVLYLDAANRYSYPGSGTTWSDISRGGNNGTLVNGPTFDPANGGSIVFDGSNDYVGINNTVGNLGTENFTISIVFKTTTVASPATFFAKSIGSTPTVNYGWLINQASSGELGFAVASALGSWGTTGSYSIKTVSGQINNGEWKIVNIVGDRTQSDVSIYINGVQKSLQAYVGKAAFSTVGNITNTYTLRVGSESDDASPYPIDGSIAVVHIYNKALTDAEVLQNYNATKTRFGL